MSNEIKTESTTSPILNDQEMASVMKFLGRVDIKGSECLELANIVVKLRNALEKK